ncbi:MAG: hypothetical protein K6C30_02830 [Bacteroidaceae bacterium]|nr:hypothetical protein [Bacteroidaceae bacterium]
MKTIQFTIATRGKLQTESPASDAEKQQESGNAPENGQETNPLAEQARRFVPRLHSTGSPVDARSFFRNTPWPTKVTEGDIGLCLDELRRMLLHELCKGAAVKLPGIGTFQITLKGNIELRGDHYRGRDVHVDGLRFTPDRELLSDVCKFEVDQQPYGQAYSSNQVDVEALLDELFSRQDTITRRDLEYASDLLLSKHRLSDILSNLVSAGRLIKEGRGPQTRYRRP